MERFGRILQRAESGLRIPGGRRARILAEIEQDLEDAYRAYRARGFGEDDSVRRAERLLGLSDPAVAELEQVHGTWYGRVVRRFSARGAHRIERTALAGLTAVAMALVAGAMVASGGPGPDSAVVLALLGLLAVAVALLTGDWLADLRGAAPRASPFVAMLGLGGGAVVVSALGALRELWRIAAWQVDSGGVRLGTGVAAEAMTVALAIGRAAEVLALGVVVALFSLVAGFHLRARRSASAWRWGAWPRPAGPAAAVGPDNPSARETRR